MDIFRRRVHSTWLFTAICYGLLVGIALSALWRGPLIVFFVLGGIATIVGFVVRRGTMIGLVFVGGLLIGLGRGGIEQQGREIYESLYKTHVVLSGVVADDVDMTARGTTHLRLGKVTLQGKPLPGTIFVSAKGGDLIKRSDRVTIDGALEQGFGSFPASLTGNVANIMRADSEDVPRDMRDSFASSVRRAMREPEASLGIGYLLGQKNSLPNHLIEALKVTALTHIVVASGYNLTILVRLGRRLFEKVSKYLATLTSVTLIVGFIAMTGLSPSMTRAGLISLLGLWAWYVGRKFHPMTLLGFAAALTTLVNPSYAWGDLGWLLSFAAFAGVMIVAPIVSAYFFGDKVPLVGQILIETASAQIATLPIMIMAFQQLSVIGLFANMLVLPLVPIAMLLVAIAGVGAMAFPAIATAIAWPADMIISWQLAVINWCADIPWAMSKPQWQWWHLVLYLAVLVTGLWYMKWRSGVKLYETSIVE